jgi:hypothetical protein
VSVPLPVRLMTRQGTLLHRSQDGAPDEYGDPSWVTVEQGAALELQQEVSYEAEGGALQLSTWRLFLPPYLGVDGWDAVDIDGEVYELEGDAWLARNPRTGENTHIEARVRRLR